MAKYKFLIIFTIILLVTNLNEDLALITLFANLFIIPIFIFYFVSIKKCMKKAYTLNALFCLIFINIFRVHSWDLGNWNLYSLLFGIPIVLTLILFLMEDPKKIFSLIIFLLLILSIILFSIISLVAAKYIWKIKPYLIFVIFIDIYFGFNSYLYYRYMNRRILKIKKSNCVR